MNILELMELGYDGICEDEDKHILEKCSKLIKKLEALI
jgi:hypothetical protein